MGEVAKVNVAETAALEAVPLPAVAAENKVIPAVEEKKQVDDHDDQNSDAIIVQKNVVEPVSEIETLEAKQVLPDQKAPATSPVSGKQSEAPISENITEKTPLTLIKRDAVLARIETDKGNALITAWEENEKAKIDNKTYKRICAITSWENTKRAAVEVQIKEYEEQLKKKRAEHVERTHNKLAEIRKKALENRALIEATKGQEYVKIEETATTYRATGYPPKKFFSCLGG
ncbi:Remorin 1.4 [Linum grandiflorum]